MGRTYNHNRAAIVARAALPEVPAFDEAPLKRAERFVIRMGRRHAVSA